MTVKITEYMGLGPYCEHNLDRFIIQRLQTFLFLSRFNVF